MCLLYLREQFIQGAFQNMLQNNADEAVNLQQQMINDILAAEDHWNLEEDIMDPIHEGMQRLEELAQEQAALEDRIENPLEAMLHENLEQERAAREELVRAQRELDALQRRVGNFPAQEDDEVIFNEVSFRFLEQNVLAKKERSYRDLNSDRWIQSPEC